MKRMLGFVGLMGAVSLAGCGGGGGSSAAAVGTRAAVLVTDSPREDYAHVWATIYHVELTPVTGSPIVLFDDPTGRLIDLRTLRDAAGQRFSFLGSATVPAGTYSGISVTFGETMQLYRNGVAVGNALTVDASIAKDSAGHPVLKETFTPPKTTTAASTNNFVVDFDLAHFTITGTTLLPVIKDSDGTGLHDSSRHNEDDYHGTVSGLTGTAPVLGFTLTRSSGQTLSVTTTAATTLYGAAALANGSIVEVTGTLDTTSGTLVATAVEVRPSTDPAAETAGQCAPNVFGTASALDAAAGTFTVTVSRVRGFTPTTTTVKVITSASSVYRADAGSTQTQAAFFTALASTPNVSVTGTYDAATNTLTAASLRVMDPAQNDGWDRTMDRFRHGSDRDHWGNGAFSGH